MEKSSGEQIKEIKEKSLQFVKGSEIEYDYLFINPWMELYPHFDTSIQDDSIIKMDEMYLGY